MPYKIVKKGDEYCVVKKSDNKQVACHATREKAARQIAAINASEGYSVIQETFAVADTGRTWDGGAAGGRVLDAATNSDGEINVAKAMRGFIAHVGDGSKRGDYKLGFADVVNGEITIIPRGVSQAAARLNQTQGIDRSAAGRKICSLYSQIRKVHSDWPECPITASAYSEETIMDDALEALEVELDSSTDANPEVLPNGWRGVIAGLDRPTGDNRYLQTPLGGVRTREYPLVLTLQHISDGIDIPIGTVDHVWVEGGMLHGEGTFDLGSPEGAEAARKFVAGSHQFVSIHPDQLTARYALLKQDGGIIDLSDIETEEEYNLLRSDGAQEIVVFADWRLAGLAVVSIPAYAEARIAPVFDYAPGTHANSAIVASVGGQVFNKEFFQDPKLTGPTKLTIDDNGHVYGHVALWNSCYQYGGEFSTCTKTPESASNYSAFHVHTANLGNGESIDCGVITYGNGHVSKGGLKASLDNINNVAHQAAKVRAGRDQYGVWISGEILDSARDFATDILNSPLSGHWEPNPEYGYALDMIGAHVVNVPGFRVSPIVASVSDGENVDGITITLRDSDFALPETSEGLVELVDTIIERLEARKIAKELSAAEAMRQVHMATVVARLENDARNARAAALAARLAGGE